MPAPGRVLLRQVIGVTNRCDQPWNAMRGDGAIRHCSKCRQDVYNLSEMTEDEAERLLARADDPCVRYAYRPDGTIVTAACTTGARRAPAAVVAGMAGALAYSGAFVGISAAIDAPDAEQAALRDPDAVLVAMGLRLSLRIPKAVDPRPDHAKPDTEKKLDTWPGLAAAPERRVDPPPPPLVVSQPAAAATTPPLPWLPTLGALLVLVLTLGTRRLWSRDRLRALDAWSVPQVTAVAAAIGTAVATSGMFAAGCGALTGASLAIAHLANRQR